MWYLTSPEGRGKTLVTSSDPFHKLYVSLYCQTPLSLTLHQKIITKILFNHINSDFLTLNSPPLNSDLVLIFFFL